MGQSETREEKASTRTDMRENMKKDGDGDHHATLGGFHAPNLNLYPHTLMKARLQLTFEIAVERGQVVVVAACRHVASVRCYSSTCRNWRMDRASGFGGDSAFAVAVDSSSFYSMTTMPKNRMSKLVRTHFSCLLLRRLPACFGTE